MTKLYITGNSGYIGSYLASHFDTKYGCDLGWFSHGNGLDYRYTHIDADVIIHLAGHSSEPMCNNDPDGAWRNNATGFWNLASKLRDDQVLIYASSASVYSKNPFSSTETDMTSSARTYDCTKIVNDAVAQMFVNSGKSIIGLRFGTVAGSSKVQRVDTIINAMTLSAITNNQINCVDPDVRRTMLFLEDMATAIDLVIQNPIAGIYNLGSLNTTVGEIARAVSNATSAPINTTVKNGNFYDFHLNSSKFIDTFGDFKTTNMGTVINKLTETLPTSNKGRRDAVPTDKMSLL